MSQYDTGKVKSEQKYMYFIMLLIWYVFSLNNLFMYRT